MSKKKKVDVVPVVIEPLGAVTNSFEKRIEKLE